MNRQNYLRLLLITKSGESKTFSRSLVKLVQVVLYENRKTMTIEQIIKQVEEKFSLEFTENEVLEVINNKRSDIVRDTSKKETSFTLNSKRINIFSKNEKENTYKRIINDFTNIYDTYGKNKNEIEGILSRFFYQIFNSNINTLLLLLKNERNNYTLDFCEGITEEEKVIINNFLDWDNKNKNQIIFDLVSYCIDYCMLTIKKTSPYFAIYFLAKAFTLMQM